MVKRYFAVVAISVTASIATQVVLMPRLALAAGSRVAPEVLRAKRFELVNESGNLYAALFVASGTGSLAVYGEPKAGRPTREFAALGPDSLSLSGADGQVSVMLTAIAANRPAFGPRLELLDEKLNTRAILGVAEIEDARTGSKETTSPGSLVLFGPNGKVTGRLP